MVLDVLVPWFFRRLWFDLYLTTVGRLRLFFDGKLHNSTFRHPNPSSKCGQGIRILISISTPVRKGDFLKVRLVGNQFIIFCPIGLVDNQESISEHTSLSDTHT